MSLVVERFLLCDYRISDNCQEEFGVDNRVSWQNLTKLRAGAKKSDWKTLKHGDCCPDCYAKIKAKKAKCA